MATNKTTKRKHIVKRCNQYSIDFHCGDFASNDTINENRVKCEVIQPASTKREIEAITCEACALAYLAAIRRGETPNGFGDYDKIEKLFAANFNAETETEKHLTAAMFENGNGGFTFCDKGAVSTAQLGNHLDATCVKCKQAFLAAVKKHKTEHNWIDVFGVNVIETFQKAITDAKPRVNRRTLEKILRERKAIEGFLLQYAKLLTQCIEKDDSFITHGILSYTAEIQRLRERLVKILNELSDYYANEKKDN